MDEPNNVNNSMVLDFEIEDNNFKFASNISAALAKSFKNNKEMCKSLNVTKKEFDISLIDAVLEALNYKDISENIRNNGINQ